MNFGKMPGSKKIRNAIFHPFIQWRKPRPRLPIKKKLRKKFSDEKRIRSSKLKPAILNLKRCLLRKRPRRKRSEKKPRLRGFYFWSFTKVIPKSFWAFR